PLPDARVSFQINRGQAGIGFVPNLTGQRVAAQKIFIFLFILAAVEDEPVRARITDSVAEDGVQTEARLVNEIVHVTFDSAIVVAEKNHPLFAIEIDPAREMNRANASEPAGPGNMPRGPIHR